MFNKVLLASDGSPESARALALTRHLAVQDGADVEVVHVREYRLGIPSPMERTDHGDAARESAVKEQARELASAGLPAEFSVIASTADGLAAALAERAEAIDADAIVVGADMQPAYGSTGARTVTQQLVQIAPCPVVVIPLRVTGRRETEAARTAAASTERSPR